jgi:Cys-tRNA(Pro)/Cys-tRNA(Cys) deacylase
VDRPLLDYPTVLIGGGATAIEIELSPADLVRISGATVESITS